MIGTVETFIWLICRSSLETHRSNIRLSEASFVVPVLDMLNSLAPTLRASNLRAFDLICLISCFAGLEVEGYPSHLSDISPSRSQGLGAVIPLNH